MLLKYLLVSLCLSPADCLYCCHLKQPENMTEDEDVLIGEGPTLHRPLSALEKLHIIIGYALSRRDIR